MGTVYLITNDYIDFKIGITSKPIEKRLKQLQTGNSEKIKLVKCYKTKNYKMMEGWLHRKFFDKRLEGEWFSLNDSDVLSFIETCEEIDKTINLLKEENHFFRNHPIQT